MLHVATSHLCFFQFSHPKCNGNLSVTYERHNYSFSTPLFYVLAFKTEYALVPTCKRLKSRTVRWAEHLELMGEERGRIGSWWGNRREGDHWGDLGVDGWIILRWICRRWDVDIWTGLGWPRIETGGGRL